MNAKSVAVLASCLAISFLAIQPGPAAEVATTSSRKVVKAAYSSYRLPKSVTPELYELEFIPDLKDFSFKGRATIDVHVKEPTDTIVLNALDLNISFAEITSIKAVGERQPYSSGMTKNIGTVSVDQLHEQVRITFKTPIKTGFSSLYLKFTGELNDKLRGFYRSHYTDDQGEKKWLATTQMEPTDARRMFPCFDEPEMKAKFKITTYIDKGLTAISNGKLRGDVPTLQGAASKDYEGKVAFAFEPSAKMSSYLVALIIGNFKPTQTKVVEGVPVTVWAVAGKEQLGNYALDAACDILKYQREYFGIAYPSNKLDLIAIPDFRSGAMENLGAITFREANLLVDENTGSNVAKRNVFAIIAHEIAHQWFGDLVTMRWWNDIWLNEAFASWMGTKTVEAIHPEWRELTKAILTRNGSMLVDELQATRAIHSNVADPKQAAEMFDSITYDKGESILWMLESYVGAQKFQAGVHDYLSEHTFGNATSEDLWMAIGKATALPISALMKSWVFQPGFPILEASTAGGGPRVLLSQQRFLGMPGVNPDNSTWFIPAVIRELKPFAKDNEKFTKLFFDRNETVPLTSGWSKVVANAGGRGFYRTQYDPNAQKLVAEHFDWLSPEERLAFLSDVSALTWKGSLPVEDKLSIALKTTKETDPIVQEQLVDFCWHPYVYMNDSELPEYEKLVRAVLGPVKSKLGWLEQPGEEDSVKDLRRAVLSLLGTVAKDKPTIVEAREMYKKYMHDRQSIPADVAAAVLTVVTYNGGATEYDEIVAALKKEKIPELEKRFLTALTHFGQAELTEKTLNMVLSAEVRSQDGFRVLGGMLDGERTKYQSWSYVKAHWDEVTKKFPPRSLANLAYACESFDKPIEEQDLKKFFASHDLPYARSAVARMLEDVHRKVLYRQRNEKAIQTWVKQQASSYWVNEHESKTIPDSR